MSFYTPWSIGRVNVNFTGVDLSEGKPDDTFISIAPVDPERIKETVGHDGNVAVSVSLNNAANISLTYFASSDNAKLLNNAFLALRENDKIGESTASGEGALVITDPSGIIMLETGPCLFKSSTLTDMDSSEPKRTFTFLASDMKQASVSPAIGAAVNSMLESFGATVRSPV